ncbi:MAG: DUF445 domain-containing protein [Methylococcales bacterium]|nr:DUF445 domain-containing protein [Methylococcales bacterium]
MNDSKNTLTHALALTLIIAGYLSPIGGELLKTMGFFALSGAVTNWLAVHMLFEKVPLLYGSGVIPNRFIEFKASIKDLLLQQFFRPEHIERFIETEERQGKAVLNLTPILDAVDYDRVFNVLVESVMASQFGAMLGMMGGAEALAPLKPAFTEKMRGMFTELTESERFQQALNQGLDAQKISHDLVAKIETVIDQRLAELTPEQVKTMVQDIIRQHLGWLVVWGGVFGGLIGALFQGLS